MTARVDGRARDAERVLERTRDLISARHRAVIADLPASVGHIAGYHAGWWDADGRPSANQGKAVRPAFTLACARAAGGDETAAVPVGVAVELLHDFSLLHDDVMDGDPVRRHRPAVWSVFGVSHAILTGDALLTAAFRLVEAGEPVRLLSEACLRLCEGQAADLVFADRAIVTLTECVRTAERKTGALLAAACRLGAMAGGAGAGAARHYDDFGRQLGVVFQLIDDILGIWGDPEITGKPAGSDLVSRKKTLPVVAALASATPEARQLSQLYQQHQRLDEPAAARAAQLVEAAGGRDWAHAEADRRIQAAMASLAAADPAPAGADDLRLLVDLITRRDH
jgi:geranylgeranyl diphosphate synthase, type I